MRNLLQRDIELFYHHLYRFIHNPIISYNCIITVVGLGEDGSLVWVEGDAEALNFEDDSIDGYTIAFGIRNVTHIEKVLSEAYRQFTYLYANQTFTYVCM